MPELITRRVPLGISACVFRCPVRYNGKSFDALGTLGRERADFVFTPVCPECAAGLGVPRDPIHLTGTGQQVLLGEAKVKSRRGRVVTDEVIAGSRASMETLERAGVRALIFKEASPTCGVYKARVGKRRTETSEGSGVFGAMLLDTGWFLIPDKALANPLLWWDWRRRLHAWLWLVPDGSSSPTRRSLIRCSGGTGAGGSTRGSGSPTDPSGALQISMRRGTS